MVEVDSLIRAIQEEDAAEINRWSVNVREVLIGYLMIRYRASYEDAQDCVQDTLVMIFEKVPKNTLKTHNPGAYVLAAARNNYFKMFNDNKRKVSEQLLDHEYESHPDPTSILIDQEMLDILYNCIGKLTIIPKKIILYMLANPEAKAEVVAQKFDTTPNNIWTRKHRINQELLGCIEKHS